LTIPSIHAGCFLKVPGAEIRQQDPNRVVAALRDTVHLTIDDKSQQEMPQSLVCGGGVTLAPPSHPTPQLRANSSLPG
jgi:hypothetical protein